LGNKEKVPKENNTILYSIEKCINHDKKVKNTAVLPSLLANVGKGSTCHTEQIDYEKRREEAVMVVLALGRGMKRSRTFTTTAKRCRLFHYFLSTLKPVLEKD